MDADQPQHFDAKNLEHAANVAVSALIERELEPGVLFALTEDFHLAGTEVFSVVVDAFLELSESLVSTLPLICTW